MPQEKLKKQIFLLIGIDYEENGEQWTESAHLTQQSAKNAGDKMCQNSNKEMGYLIEPIEFKD